MSPEEFIARWRVTTRTERSAAQEHFLDLCASLAFQPAPSCGVRFERDGLAIGGAPLRAAASEPTGRPVQRDREGSSPTSAMRAVQLRTWKVPLALTVFSRRQADSGSQQPMAKIDQSMPIVAETEQVSSAEISVENQERIILTDWRVGLRSCPEKICAASSARYMTQNNRVGVRGLRPGVRASRIDANGHPMFAALRHVMWQA